MAILVPILMILLDRRKKNRYPFLSKTYPITINKNTENRSNMLFLILIIPITQKIDINSRKCLKRLFLLYLWQIQCCFYFRFPQFVLWQRLSRPAAPPPIPGRIPITVPITLLCSITPRFSFISRSYLWQIQCCFYFRFPQFVLWQRLSRYQSFCSNHTALQHNSEIFFYFPKLRYKNPSFIYFRCFFIFSCESANNATSGGALVPMLALAALPVHRKSGRRHPLPYREEFRLLYQSHCFAA